MHSYSPETDAADLNSPLAFQHTEACVVALLRHAAAPGYSFHFHLHFHFHLFKAICRRSLHERKAANHPITNEEKTEKINIKFPLISVSQNADMPATENTTKNGVIKFFKIDEKIVVSGRPLSPNIWNPIYKTIP